MQRFLQKVLPKRVQERGWKHQQRFSSWGNLPRDDCSEPGREQDRDSARPGCSPSLFISLLPRSALPRPLLLPGFPPHRETQRVN